MWIKKLWEMLNYDLLARIEYLEARDREMEMIILYHKAAIESIRQHLEEIETRNKNNVVKLELVKK